MVISCQLHDNAILYNDQPNERTSKFKYLGSTHDKRDKDGEVKIKTTMTKAILRQEMTYETQGHNMCDEMLHMANTVIQSRNLITQS